LLVRDEVMRLLEDRRELIELRRAESLRQEAVEALLATKSDLEARIALRTREVEHAHAKIRNILERVADGFVALDRDWCYSFVNARAAAMFGRTPEELVGKHIWTVFPDGVGQPFHLAYERAMREQVVITLAARYEPWDRWFENRIYPSPDGISIFFTETTDKRKAEIALEDSARRLAEAQAIAHVGSWEWAVADNRVVWSDEMHRIYGTTPASFDGTYEGFLARVHPEDVGHTRAVVEDAYREPKRFTYDHRVVRSDGEVRMLHTVGEAIADSSGRVARMVGTCWDMTEQWQAQRKLLLTGALLEALLASVDEGVLAVDAAGCIIAVNDVCARRFALPAQLCAAGSPAAPLVAHIESRTGKSIAADARPFTLDGRPAGAVWTFRAAG
jgi:PAS domain S-box-containing protein